MHLRYQIACFVKKIRHPADLTYPALYLPWLNVGAPDWVYPLQGSLSTRCMQCKIKSGNKKIQSVSDVLSNRKTAAQDGGCEILDTMIWDIWRIREVSTVPSAAEYFLELQRVLLHPCNEAQPWDPRGWPMRLGPPVVIKANIYVNPRRLTEAT